MRLDPSVTIRYESKIRKSTPPLAPKGNSVFPASSYWGDEDNLRKALNDALQATGMVVDDGLVLGGENFKCFGVSDAVEIRIYGVVLSEEDVA